MVQSRRFLAGAHGLLDSFPVFNMINSMVNSIENSYKKELQNIELNSKNRITQ